MTTMIRVSRQGRLTLPRALCRKLGLDKTRTRMVIVEEREGGLLLRPALPIRDIPKKKIKEWVARDEAEMAALRVTAPRTKAKVPVPAPHCAELNRRLAALTKNPEHGRPWAKVRDALRRRRC